MAAGMPRAYRPLVSSAAVRNASRGRRPPGTGSGCRVSSPSSSVPVRSRWPDAAGRRLTGIRATFVVVNGLQVRAAIL
jgi:hypothetical protein